MRFIGAREAGVVVVAAAGNEFSTVPSTRPPIPTPSPSRRPSSRGELANYSSRGEWVKFAAPACMPTTVLGGGFGIGCGDVGLDAGRGGDRRATAGARSPYASVSQIETALEHTAHPVAGVRFGSVDAFAALEALGQPPPRLEPSIEGFPRNRRDAHRLERHLVRVQAFRSTTAGSAAARASVSRRPPDGRTSSRRRTVGRRCASC